MTDDSPTFSVEAFDAGFVIHATWPDDHRQMLVGQFVSEEAAQAWLQDGGGQRWLAQRHGSGQ